MAKFEIEARIGANSEEFKRKMKEAAEESREFAKKVKENVGQAKEVLGEVAGEAGLGKMVKMLGSATAAAGIFGAAIVAACIDGTKEFAKLEDRALQFGSLLKDKEKGMEVAKDIEEMPGHMGSQDELNAGMMSLIEAYKALGEADPAEKAKAKLLELSNVSAQTGKSIATMAEQYRNFVSGGEEAEKNGAKLAKAIPTISALLEEKDKGSKGQSLAGLEDQKKMLSYQLQYTGSQNPDYKEKKEQLDDLDKQIEAKKSGKPYDVATELKKFTPRELDSLMAKEYGPQGPSGHAAEDKGNTTSGAFMDLAHATERARTALGEGLAPVVKTFADELNKEMPTIAEAAHSLGEGLGNLTPAVKALFELLDGHTSHEWGTKSSVDNQRGKLERGPEQMRFDSDGNPIALTPLQRDKFDQTKIRGQIANAGDSEVNLFGSRTGGKDLQQQQLDVMSKIEKNTAEGVQ